MDQISSQTNIDIKLLNALETDDFSKLPASTFTKGFITSYAKVVSLSAPKALAVFRRDFIVGEAGKILPKGLSKPLDKKTVVTSKLAIFGGIFLLLIIFSAYLFFQLKNYSQLPQIDILRPKAHSVVKGPIIPIKGFVSADSSVYINGKVIDVFPTGEFQSTVSLSAGNHNIKIKAIDSQSKESEVTIPVLVVDK